MHVMAAKAITFGEALKPEFQDYIKQVIVNAKELAETLVYRGYRIVTGGTDSHIVWLDLTPKKLTGNIFKFFNRRLYNLGCEQRIHQSIFTSCYQRGKI